MIREFQGQYRFLSNFWPAKVHFRYFEFPSVENAYQAAKCLHREDLKRFLTCSAVEAKRLGRQVEMDPTFQAEKLDIMKHLVESKFHGNPHLGDLLLATGDQTLVEGNRWGDTFWGANINTMQGWNHLGQILMAVRRDLQLKSGRPALLRTHSL